MAASSATQVPSSFGSFTCNICQEPITVLGVRLQESFPYGEVVWKNDPGEGIMLKVGNQGSSDQRCQHVFHAICLAKAQNFNPNKPQCPTCHAEVGSSVNERISSGLDTLERLAANPSNRPALGMAIRLAFAAMQVKVKEDELKEQQKKDQMDG